MKTFLRVLTATAAVLVCLVVGASGAWAAQVNLCVPTAAGQPITSNGSGTSCSSGNTAVALPSSKADQQTLISVLPHISFVSSGVGGKPTIRFSGVNVQVVSGSGSTSGTVNGEGNLVIGYDESPGSQTGSHNLVLGNHQAYSSYGSVLGGTNNTDSGHSSVVFGSTNIASGGYSSVTGGRSATASGAYASVQGGFDNKASAGYGSIAGGCDNLAGSGTVPTPPSSCGTAAEFAEIAGGLANQASGVDATISGGESGLASGDAASVSGGNSDQATGTFGSWAGGGYQNASTGSSSAAVGGDGSTASGLNALTTGGKDNTASGSFASVAGGYLNQAGDGASFIGAGCQNLTGVGTTSAGACAFVYPAEAILGGAGQQLTTTDSTYPAGP